MLIPPSPAETRVAKLDATGKLDIFGVGGFKPVDIGVTAVVNIPSVGVVGDNVDENDIAYNKVFPYAATPQNGRIHPHHGLN